MPTIADLPDIPQHTIQTVCGQTGIRAVTLRAWERRCHMLQPRRAGGNYRLYSERDIAALRWLKSRIDSGLPISRREPTEREPASAPQLYCADAMKNLTTAFFLALSFSVAACAAPTQPPAATPPPLVPSATAAAATSTLAPAGAASPAPTAVPMIATATAQSSPTAAPTPTPATAATSTANPTVAGGLVGLWQGNNNSFYLLNKDGTWNWDQTLQQVLTAPENQGRWWVEGDIFRIQDLSGKAPCPPGQIGSYQAQLSGDMLVLTAVADLCGPRIDQTAGQYGRQPAGP